MMKDLLSNVSKQVQKEVHVYCPSFIILMMMKPKLSLFANVKQCM